ncbi:MAG: type VI secretion system contractile sheath small subunit, partial [Steroidobacteraceae bacterium]
KQIPFVMGVLADLSGKSAEELPEIEQRKALDIDMDNFDSRLKAMKPRVTFAVPNKLTGEGQLGIDITFESMDDFSPAALAKKVEPLAKLLEARTQLSNLVTYMDGKAGAEKLITQALQDPALLQSLAAAPKAAE